MPCLWKLWPWAKSQKPHDEEDSLLSARTTIIQSWEMALKNDIQRHGSESNTQQRYVRFGIGGAGNMCKFGSLPICGW
ncbi:hypothetical protein N7490_009141 [Penicillium lividum]|nr:hypothetical protein N7490_009141 [Penicillium lividum]